MATDTPKIVDEAFRTRPDVRHEGASAEIGRPGTTRQVIDRLRSDACTLADRREAVLIGESLDFSPAEKPMLIDLLFAFVAAHRKSNDDPCITAVCSAVRKLVTNLPANRLGELAPLLDADSVAPIHLDVELEICKMISHRVSESMTDEFGDVSPLIERLTEVAKTYVNPRLLGRPKHGATALNAVVALLLLPGRHHEDILRIVRSAGASWFERFVRSRISGIADSASGKPERFRKMCETLNSWR